MKQQTVLIDKDDFLEWRFRDEEDIKYFGRQVVNGLFNDNSYSNDLDDVFAQTTYIPMECINNWEDLNLNQEDLEEEEIYTNDYRFEFEFEFDDKEQTNKE